MTICILDKPQRETYDQTISSCVHNWHHCSVLSKSPTEGDVAQQWARVAYSGVFTWRRWCFHSSCPCRMELSKSSNHSPSVRWRGGGIAISLRGRRRQTETPQTVPQGHRSVMAFLAHFFHSCALVYRCHMKCLYCLPSVIFDSDLCYEYLSGCHIHVVWYLSGLFLFCGQKPIRMRISSIFHFPTVSPNRITLLYLPYQSLTWAAYVVF